MDTMKATKLVGALCVAGLVFLFGKWGAEVMFHRGAPEAAHGNGHGDGHGEEVAQAYTVETGEEGGDHGGEEEAGSNYASFMASADPAKGEKVFAKCKACHKLEAGAHGTGPSLNAIVGRDVGAAEGFKYSQAMIDFGGVWSEDRLFAFIRDVKGTIKGTKMSFAGIKSEQQNADLIAFLMGDSFDAGKYAAAAAAATAPTETEAEEAATEEAPAALTGDAEKGAKVFAKCKACHKVEAGANGTGPSLFGIVGQDIGAVEGFKYSKAMEATEGVWDEAALNAFLKDVKGTIKGTKMSFAGIKNDQQRADLIAYLATLH